MMRDNWGFRGTEPFEQTSGIEILWLILMIILWAAVIVAIVMGIRALVIHSRNNRASAVAPSPGSGPLPPGAGMGAPSSAAQTVLAILEERYARGEIDREEFLQRKADLGFASPVMTPAAAPVVAETSAAQAPAAATPPETTT